MYTQGERWWHMNTSTGKRKGGATSLLVLVALASLSVGCLDSTEPLETIFWQGSFEPPAQLSGGIAMMSEANVTIIGVEVEGADDAERLHWIVRTGSCDAPGSPLAPAVAFPFLLLGEAGSAEAQAILYRRVGDADRYAGQILADPADGGEVLACANMVRVDP
jgi:hypothetical protein